MALVRRPRDLAARNLARAGSTLLVASALLVGCARDAAPPKTAAAPDEVAHYQPSASAPASWYETPRAPPRLSQVVRIGAEDDAFTDARIYVERGAPAPAAQTQAPSTPTYGYGYGYGYFGYGSYAGGRYGAPARSFNVGTPSTVGVGTSRSGVPSVGGNWAAPPSYGPRFPFPSGGRGVDVTRR